MDLTDAPPPALEHARVIWYAVVDETVLWTGRQRLYVGEELLGPVPRLAICQREIDGDADYLLVHCTEKWDVLGVIPNPSVDKLKEKAERWYCGINERWVKAEVPPEAAENWIREQVASMTCSFCGKPPLDVERIVSGRNACICGECIIRLHAATFGK
jgi:hypothetical protein